MTESGELRSTPEEEGWTDEGGVSAHAWRSQNDVDELSAEIRPYLARHRETFVDLWLESDGDDATLVVAFLRDIEEHQAALGPRIRVCQRPYTEVELQRVADEAFAISASGVTVMSAHADADEGVAVLAAVTADPEGLRADLAARYGDMIWLDWLGPNESVPASVEITGWSIATDDRTLTVCWYGLAAEALPLELRETPDAVFVLAQEMHSVGAMTLAAIRQRQSGLLSAPLGDRAVIDMPTGKTVRSGPPTLDEIEHAPETTLELALRHFTERKFTAALAAFDRLAANDPEALSDPRLARKRNIAAKWCARTVG